MKRPIQASSLASAKSAMSFKEGENFCVQGYFATREEADQWHSQMHMVRSLRDLSVLDRKVINVILCAAKPVSVPYITSQLEGADIKVVRHSVGGLECRGLAELRGWINCPVAKGNVAAVHLTALAGGMINGDSE